MLTKISFVITKRHLEECFFKIGLLQGTPRVQAQYDRRGLESAGTRGHSSLKRMNTNDRS